jgi:GNAT superfamily N-acetyltransferase
MNHRVRIRPAEEADLDAVVELGALVSGLPTPRRVLGRSTVAANALAHGGVSASTRARYRAVIEDPERVVVLAVDDDDVPLGMGIITTDKAGHLLDVPAVRLTHLVVDRKSRRRGAGRAIVAAAVAFAERHGIEHVMVGAPPISRESNRFFARLGFAPVMVRRVASVQMLRRNLVVPEVGFDVAGPEAARRRRRRRTGHDDGATSSRTA